MLDISTFKALLSVVGATQEAMHNEIKIYDALLDDFDGIPKNLAKIEDMLVDTLELSTGSTGLVEWYVYDCFMGTVPLENDGVIISTVEDLYTAILKENDV